MMTASAWIAAPVANSTLYPEPDGVTPVAGLPSTNATPPSRSRVSNALTKAPRPPAGVRNGDPGAELEAGASRRVVSTPLIRPPYRRSASRSPGERRGQTQLVTVGGVDSRHQRLDESFPGVPTEAAANEPAERFVARRAPRGEQVVEGHASLAER